LRDKGFWVGRLRIALRDWVRDLVEGLGEGLGEGLVGIYYCMGVMCGLVR